MSESQFSIAGIVFLISALCACGSKPSFETLTTAQVASETSAENGSGMGKGQGQGKAGKHDADDDDYEECEADDYNNSSVVALCHVDGDEDAHQVCTDAATALSKFGLDPGKPNQLGANGADHLGAC